MKYIFVLTFAYLTHLKGQKLTLSSNFPHWKAFKHSYTSSTKLAVFDDCKTTEISLIFLSGMIHFFYLLNVCLKCQIIHA